MEETTEALLLLDVSPIKSKFIVINRRGISWRTKNGVQQPNYYGSITQSSTVSLGTDVATGEEVYTPLKGLLPMVDPNEIVFGGWDISSANLAESMERAAVLDWDLQRQLIPYMKDIKPLPGIYLQGIFENLFIVRFHCCQPKGESH